MSRVGGVGVRAQALGRRGAPHYSPAVKQVARRHDIQLSEVTVAARGDGSQKDVLDAAAKRGTSTFTPRRPNALQTRREELVPFNHMRKTIAERWSQSPYVGSRHNVFRSRLLRYRAVRAGRSLTAPVCHQRRQPMP